MRCYKGICPNLLFCWKLLAADYLSPCVPLSPQSATVPQQLEACPRVEELVPLGQCATRLVTMLRSNCGLQQSYSHPFVCLELPQQEGFGRQKQSISKAAVLQLQWYWSWWHLSWGQQTGCMGLEQSCTFDNVFLRKEVAELQRLDTNICKANKEG